MLQPGTQIGPFTIEKVIGAGAMGAVYRGLYAKTGQKVAIKIMLPGVAENRNSAERFRREVEILKQLNHPNIVRLLGDGKHEGQRYYAMEYIQGESLDRVLTRRGRLSWEEVVQLGQQLCAALQHAHEKGVVHRDLKPSNLMILTDGTLKLTDFGIAKDLDVTQLTEANCTVGTASYMSPEQCRGERNLTHKSDLYSLGIVLYELLTGKKPFHADNVMDMFLLHVQADCERPSRLVDIPKWLDVLIVQLMEKKPEQRPRDAALVAEALEDVVEKVEARQSAGIVAAGKRRPGESRDEGDREAIQALTAGRKKKKKKHVERVPWQQQGWVKAVALLVPLVFVAFVLWLVFKPPSAEALHARIEKRMASGNTKEEEAAYLGPMKEYLRRYGSRDNEQTLRVLAWDEQVGVRLAEEDAIKTADMTKTISIEKMDALKPAQKKAVFAVLAENEGNLSRARVFWEEIARDHKTDPGNWAKLAERRLSQLEAMRNLESRLTEHLAALREFAREPQIADETERKAFVAKRFEEVGDLHGAFAVWGGLKSDLKTRPEARSWYLLAASRVAGPPPKSDDETKLRVGIVEKRLKEIDELRKKNQLRDAEILCLHLIALYPNARPEREFGPLTARAKELFDAIQKDRTGGPK